MNRTKNLQSPALTQFSALGLAPASGAASDSMPLRHAGRAVRHAHKARLSTPTHSSWRRSLTAAVAVVGLAVGTVACMSDDEVIDLDLPGDGLYPEGIVLAPSGDLLVSGFGDGSIVRVAPDDAPDYFKAPGADGLSSAVGMAIDVERNRLWVSNFSFATLTSDLKVFDLDDGSLLATVVPVDGEASQFFNEIAIDDDGRVYVSDTLTPTLWTAGPELGVAEVFVSDPLLRNDTQPFGLNGLALTPDGDYLVASVMDRITQGDGRLVRIDVETREVVDVALSGPVEIFGGSDGMFFTPGGGLVMINVTPPAAIVTAEFSDDFGEAVLVERGAYDDELDRPTSSTIRGDRLIVVDSQLDHIIDDENGALGTAPELPFQLTSVPLSGLMVP